jgi:hypothetical protein
MIPGTHFCWRLSRSEGHSAAGRASSIEKSNDLIVNQNSDLLACSILRQPTTLPRTPTVRSHTSQKQKYRHLFTQWRIYQKILEVKPCKLMERNAKSQKNDQSFLSRKLILIRNNDNAAGVTRMIQYKEKATELVPWLYWSNSRDEIRCSLVPGSVYKQKALLFISFRTIFRAWMWTTIPIIAQKPLPQPDVTDK